MAVLVALHTAITNKLTTTMSKRTDRGSVTTEHVLWAVAVIAIVAIVVAAIKGYVETQAGNIE